VKILVVQETSWTKRGPHQQHHLFERLKKKGHDILIVDYDFTWKIEDGFGLQKKKSKIVKGQVIKDIKINVITPKMIKFPILNRASIIFYHTLELIKIFKNFKPDILFVFGILNSSIAISLAKLYRVKSYFYVIDHLHALLESEIEKNIAKAFEIYNAKISDNILVINDGLENYIKLISNVKRKKIQKISGGVDIKNYNIDNLERKKIRKKYGIKDNQKVLFFMGYLYDFTRLDVISKKILNDNMKDYTILIVGDGPLMKRLKIIKQKYDNQNQLILTGWVKFNKIPKYLSAADICILPSENNEIMRNIVPIKYYEYIAAKKAVISTDFKGVIKEFGLNGGIKFFKNLDDFFELLLLEKSVFDEIAKVGYSKIIESDWKNLLIKLEDLITT